MGNKDKNAVIINAGDVAKDLRATMKVAQEQASALDKKEDASLAEAMAAEKAQEAAKKQEASLQQAVAVNSVKKDPIQKRTRAEKAKDKILRNLEIYEKDPIGSVNKMVALQRILETVMQHPVPSNFNLILDFFKRNKNEVFLKEENALQNIAVLPSEARIRIEMLYHLLYSLVHGSATRQTISLTALRSVFGSDDFINWVSATMRNANRG